MCCRVLTLFSSICCPFIYLYIFVVSYFFHLSVPHLLPAFSTHKKENKKQPIGRKLVFSFFVSDYFVQVFKNLNLNSCPIGQIGLFWICLDIFANFSAYHFDSLTRSAILF